MAGDEQMFEHLVTQITDIHMKLCSFELTLLVYMKICELLKPM